MFHYRLQSFQYKHIASDFPREYTHIPYELVGVYTSFELAQEGLASSRRNPKLKDFIYVIDTITLNLELRMAIDNDIWIAAKDSNIEFYNFRGMNYLEIPHLFFKCLRGVMEDHKVTIKPKDVRKKPEEEIEELD